MTNSSSLTTSSMLGEITRLLLENGYLAIEGRHKGVWSSERARLFEDPYGVVGVVVYETWDALEKNWERAQTELVELISTHLSKNEPKAWDGYLVLLTPNPVTEEVSVANIRYDTTRLRKIVGTGEEITRVSDLTSVLAPLLPIRDELLDMNEMDLFSRLPRILEEQGIPRGATTALIDAFIEQEPLMEHLSAYWEDNETH